VSWKAVCIKSKINYIAISLDPLIEETHARL
jgi:hypothetical protein